MPAPQPTEIRYDRADRSLTVRFDDGAAFSFSAEFLRTQSPSAEVRGHHAGERVLVAGKKTVGIKAIEPVGNYAIQIVFDDGHDTGLYSWALLHEYGRTRETLWAAYLGELEQAGMSR